MAQVPVLNWSRKKLRTLELPDAVFDYPLKEHLVYEAVCAHHAAARAGTHKAKNRSEVSGGTRKLWKQKHTGRARMGDNRSPLWRHGGVVFGPVPRSYAWALPKKMRRNALKSVLAERLREGKLLCLDSLEVSSPKTRELEASLSKKLGVAGKALLVPEELSRNLELAARNHPRFKVVRALGLSVVDLIGHDTLIFSEPALKRLSEALAR